MAIQNGLDFVRNSYHSDFHCLDLLHIVFAFLPLHHHIITRVDLHSTVSSRGREESPGDRLSHVILPFDNDFFNIILIYV